MHNGPLGKPENARQTHVEQREVNRLEGAGEKPRTSGRS
jgi:hypothetical protein